MKKLFIALTGVLALISLVSCQKENLEKEELPNKEGVTVKIVSGAGTKTYAVDGEIPTIYWSEGDYVAFFEVVDGTYNEGVFSNDAVINGRKASFSATLTSEDPAGSSYKYSAVYPGTNIGNYGDQDYDGEEDWLVLLPKAQNLIKGNMALDSDILISEQLDNGSARIENNTESLFTFHRLGTVVRLQLKGITPGELIRTITIHAPTNVAGYVKYEIATGQPASNYYMGYGDITLNLGDVTATGDDVIWFRVFSPEKWNSLGIEVVTSGAKYLRDGSDDSHAVIVPTKPIQFINEGLTKFAVNLADYRVENTVKSVPYVENFDTDNSSEWAFIDSDGDEYNWDWNTNFLYTISGTGILQSASYINNEGPLTPDNWAFTPAIQLTEGNVLSFWVAGQDASWAEEHYAVYITDQATNASNLTSCVKLHEETIDGADAATPVQVSGNFRRFVIAIPAQFANKTVYIGFRHFGCSDMFYLNLDDVAIYDTNPKKASSGYFSPNLQGTSVRINKFE